MGNGCFGEEEGLSGLQRRGKKMEAGAIGPGEGELVAGAVGLRAVREAMMAGQWW